MADADAECLAGKTKRQVSRDFGHVPFPKPSRSLDGGATRSGRATFAPCVENRRCDCPRHHPSQMRTRQSLPAWQRQHRPSLWLLRDQSGSRRWSTEAARPARQVPPTSKRPVPRRRHSAGRLCRVAGSLVDLRRTDILFAAGRRDFLDQFSAMVCIASTARPTAAHFSSLHHPIGILMNLARSGEFPRESNATERPYARISLVINGHSAAPGSLSASLPRRSAQKLSPPNS
jgi:hypothetical protein